MSAAVCAGSVVSAVGAAIVLCRPANVAIACVAILVGGRFADADTSAVLALLPAAAALLAAGYAWNDADDAERDRVSHAARPIPAGMLSKRAARTLAAALFVAGIVCAIALPAPAAARAMLAGWALVLASYRRIATRFPALKGIVASVLTASALLLGASAGPATSAAIFPALFALLLTWIREMVKDLGDRAGDRAVGSPTWIDSLPPARARAAIAVAAAALLLLIPLPAFFFGYGPLYLAIAAIGVGASLVVLCRDLGRLVPDLDAGTAAAPFVRASRLLKASMVAGLFALFIGATGGPLG